MQTLLPRALRNAVLLFSVGLEDDLTWFEGNKFTTLEPLLTLGQHRLELKVAPATIATIVRYSTVRNHHTHKINCHLVNVRTTFQANRYGLSFVGIFNVPMHVFTTSYRCCQEHQQWSNQTSGQFQIITGTLCKLQGRCPG